MDCTVTVADSAKVKCDGKVTCNTDATWSNIYGPCDQLTYPRESNYMVIEYLCIDREMTTKAPPYYDKNFVQSTTKTSSTDKYSNVTATDNFTSPETSDSKTPTTPAMRTTILMPPSPTIQTNPATKTPQTSTASTTQAPLKLVETTTPNAQVTPETGPSTGTTTLTTESSLRFTYGISENNRTMTTSAFNATGSTSKGNDTGSSSGKTQEHTAYQKASSDELSDAMVGAIVGGSLGMMLTFVVFVFYWGRKRHLRIVGKHQTTVWDYLLSQTFTVRGTRGYDHFSSIRSSASSDGEASSPTVRKNLWLPNIVHKDNTQPEDAISNYENDPDTTHRVEIHPHAEPTPYAFLNLYIDPANLSHHDVNRRAGVQDPNSHV
ncbi:hypothetical protein Btru_045548 [Bulinus truncatus]|nr:hypothetical protein Btru_045548 [Bulinus truncatus]